MLLASFSCMDRLSWFAHSLAWSRVGRARLFACLLACYSFFYSCLQVKLFVVWNLSPCNKTSAHTFVQWSSWFGWLVGWPLQLQRELSACVRLLSSGRPIGSDQIWSDLIWSGIPIPIANFNSTFHSNDQSPISRHSYKNSDKSSNASDKHRPDCIQNHLLPTITQQL